MTFSIRPATPADVPAVLPMVRAICDLHLAWDRERFDIRPEVVEMYAKWLPQRATDPDSVFLVAEDASTNRVVGYVVATIEDSIPIYWTPRCGWIHDAWIEPSHRKQGVAKALIRDAVARLRDKGISQIRGETALANNASRALLKSLGWREGTIEMMIQFEPTPAP